MNLTNIFEAITKLKEEEVDSRLKYFRAIKNEKAPYRNKWYVLKEALMLSHKKMLVDNDISVETFKNMP